MLADPILTAVRVTNPSGTYSLTTPKGEYLILDQTAKLEQGCAVAVFLTGHFMLVGRIERRPVPHRRLVIRCRDVEGNECVTRIYGLRERGHAGLARRGGIRAGAICRCGRQGLRLIKVGIAAAVGLLSAIGLAVIGDTEGCTESLLAGVGVGVLLGGWLRDACARRRCRCGLEPACFRKRRSIAPDRIGPTGPSYRS
jgi:hypothetical protein